MWSESKRGAPGGKEKLEQDLKLATKDPGTYKNN